MEWNKRDILFLAQLVNLFKLAHLIALGVMTMTMTDDG
jgi:hypothetical protein